MKRHLILTPKQGILIVLVVVLVLVHDAEGLKSFEDEHEREDEMANEFIGNYVDLPKFLFRSDWTLAAKGRVCMKLHKIKDHLGRC